MSKKKHKIELTSVDPNVTSEDLKKLEEEGEQIESPLLKSILNSLQRSGDKVTRLVLEEDPSSPNRYGGLYYQKLVMIPDSLLKRISITDDSVASIVLARSSMVSSFGRELDDRFSTGYRIEPKPHALDNMSPEDKDELKERIKEVSKRLVTCGHTKGWNDEKQMSLSSFLFQSARNAVVFGRFATDIIWVTNPTTGDRKFHSFRPADAATIYKLLPKAPEAENIREQYVNIIQEIKKEKVVPEKIHKGEYTWIQVIEGRPVNVYTSDEMIVHNCYPVTDVELNGYPLTPIDSAISAITTHINITTHNKLYFQSGRASRGMLLITSDDVDPGTLQDLKQQFNAMINSVSNAWRMPVLKVGKEDTVEWKQIDTMNRDAEFQYLADSNARVILSAFQMSPDELPAYNHLSKGTNTQTLSESNNEYKLEAARDVGIRPLLSHFQDFLNFRILPLFDEKVAKYCNIKLHGLDQESEEKENANITEWLPIHGTYDEVMEKVEKPLLGKRWGGQFPMNPVFQQTLDKYFTVGQILEHFFGVENASKEPRWDYIRDPFYFQQVQVVMNAQQMEEQKQLAQQQMQQQEQQGQQGQGADPAAKELDSGVDQLLGLMNKNESPLTESKKKLRAQHAAIVEKILGDWHHESEVALAEIAVLASKNKKK